MLSEVSMKIFDLFEEKKKEDLFPVDRIALALFKKKAGLVKDLKRDKDKFYIGVQHESSSIKRPDGKPLYLTFDNSTDSGEFEIDSLSPLKIEKGDATDKKIRKLYTKHELESKKKIGYIVKGDVTYIREIHLGKVLSGSSVLFVNEFIKLMNSLGEDLPKEETKEEEE
jgi:hypothetical protein